MKILVVLIVLSQLSKIQGTNNTENTTVFVSKGGNITLSCADSNASIVIWRRTNEIISDGPNINPQIAGSHKFAMTKEYRLNIFSITDDDLGPYWCEIQVNNEAIEKRIHVKFTERRSTELNTGRTSEQTTEMRKMQYENMVTTQSYSTGQNKRHYTIQSTGSDSASTDQGVPSTRYDEKETWAPKWNDDKTEHKTTETGFTTNERFIFYGLLAVGLVLVLIVSIVCNACINRRCRTVVMASPKAESVNRVTSSEGSENNSSNYESIRESEMLQLQTSSPMDAPRADLKLITEPSSMPKNKVQNPSIQSDSSSERLYLDVIDDTYLNPYQTMKPAGDSDSLHNYCEAFRVFEPKAVSSPEYEETMKREVSVTTDRDNKEKLMHKSVSTYSLELSNPVSSSVSVLFTAESQEICQFETNYAFGYDPVVTNEISEENVLLVSQDTSKHPNENINLSEDDNFRNNVKIYIDNEKNDGEQNDI